MITSIVMTVNKKSEKKTAPKWAPGVRERAVFLNIQRTAEVLKVPFIELFKRYDLTLVQFNVLRILRGAGPAGLACGEVGERMITRDSDITRMLDRLEARELIRRERQSADRRIVLSYITQKGLELLDELEEPVLELHRRQLKRVSRSDLMQLKSLLDKVIDTEK